MLPDLAHCDHSVPYRPPPFPHKADQPWESTVTRHFVDTQDFDKAELLQIMELIGKLKAADKAGACPPLLKDASLGMIFEEPSTRTRVSFEVAMTKLGGHALYMKPGEIHLGVRESLSDTANVLERMVDVIEARTLKHETITGLARESGVPVINGLTDYNHPTQVLCDVFTMTEHMPDGKQLEDLNVTFVGDATNVCNSLAAICTRMGINFTHAGPSAYQLSGKVRELAAANCKVAGGRLTVTDDVNAAIENADFVYTCTVVALGQPFSGKAAAAQKKQAKRLAAKDTLARLRQWFQDNEKDIARREGERWY